MTVTWVSCIFIELGKIGGLRPVWFNTWYFVNAGSFPQGDHHQPQGSHHCAANLVRRFLETVATDAACQLCGAAGVPTHRRGNLLESLGRKGGISDRFIQRVDSTNNPVASHGVEAFPGAILVLGGHDANTRAFRCTTDWVEGRIMMVAKEMTKEMMMIVLMMMMMMMMMMLVVVMVVMVVMVVAAAGVVVVDMDTRLVMHVFDSWISLRFMGASTLERNTICCCCSCCSCSCSCCGFCSCCVFLFLLLLVLLLLARAILATLQYIQWLQRLSDPFLTFYNDKAPFCTDFPVCMNANLALRETRTCESGWTLNVFSVGSHVFFTLLGTHVATQKMDFTFTFIACTMCTRHGCCGALPLSLCRLSHKRKLKNVLQPFECKDGHQNWHHVHKSDEKWEPSNQIKKKWDKHSLTSGEALVKQKSHHHHRSHY